MSLSQYVVDRFVAWMSLEPVVVVMMAIATVVLFVAAYRRGGEPAIDRPWSWLRRLVEAGAAAFLFTALLWAFRGILDDNAESYRRHHGRVSAANYDSVKTIWGSPHEQTELRVSHTREVEVKAPIPGDDPDAPVRYEMILEDQDVEQDSLVAAHGEAELSVNHRRKGSAYYSGFEAAFRMTYEVVNDSPYVTEARFHLALGEQGLYDDVRVTVDGVDLAGDLRVDEHGLGWTRPMQPQQRVRVALGYRTRGVEYFYYQMPARREIRGFSFRLIAHGLPLADVNYPDRCLTPTSVSATPDGSGTILEWTLDRAVTTAGMGIALPKPPQPGADVVRVLGRSPLALMLLVTTLCLALLILGETVHFVEIGLLSAAYCVVFLVLAGASDVVGFHGALGIGGALTIGLSQLLARRRARAVRVITLVAVAFFAIAYPLSGKLVGPDRGTFDALTTVGLILFLSGLALYRATRTHIDTTPPEARRIS
jgi:hypothetical protein